MKYFCLNHVGFIQYTVRHMSEEKYDHLPAISLFLLYRLFIHVLFFHDMTINECFDDVCSRHCLLT